MVGTVPYTSLTLSGEVPTYVGTPASDSATDRLAAHASEREERERARVEESVRDYLLHRHITRRQVTRSKILDSR